MAIRFEVRHPETNAKVLIEAEPWEKLGSIIRVATDDLQLEKAARWLKNGDKELHPQWTVEKAGLREGDTLELIPDPTAGARYPEAIWKRRLQNEYRILKERLPESATIVEIDPEDAPTRYVIEFHGISCYAPPEESGEPPAPETHRVEITLGREFPCAHPVVRAITPIFHPNVWPEDKAYCMKILHNDSWNDNNTLADVVVGIPGFLANPNLKDPADKKAARHYREHKPG